MNYFYLALLCVFFFQNISFSQWIRYTQDNTRGIRGSLVSSVICDRKGDLWIATDKGIVRYIPASGVWEEFAIYRSLNSELVYQVFESRNGDIWIAQNGSGLSRYRNKSWKNFTGDDGLNSSIYRAITETRNYIWFGSYTAGVTRYSSGSGFIQPGNEEFKGMQILSLLALGEDSLLIGTLNKGFYIFSDTVLTGFNADSGLAGNQVLCFGKTADDRIWIGTSQGAQEFDRKTATLLPVPDSLVAKPVHSIASDAEGNICFGTEGRIYKKTPAGFESYVIGEEGQIGGIHTILFGTRESWYGSSSGGLFRYSDAGWQNFHNSEGFESNVFYSITEDASGNIICSTHASIYSFDGLNWKRIHTADQSNSYGFSNLFCDSKSNIWSNFNNGVLEFDGSNWKYYTNWAGNQIRGVSDFLEYPEGVLWISTDNYGLFRGEGANRTHYGSSDGMYSDQIIGIDSGSDGKLYIAHSYEPVISSYDGENWDYQTLGIPQQYNTDFLIDMHGNFWLATYDGLYELSDSRTKNHFRWAPLYDRSISGIWESPDTAIWAAWNGHGIARFDGEEWIAYSASNVLDCDYVNGFYFDSKGAIWLATTCGIYKTDNLSSLHSTLIGRERSVAVYPNPVGDALNIEFESSNSADITIAVYSIDGRLLTSENDFYQREYNNVYTAETHDWPSGVLICTVREGTRLYTTKFIKTQY